MPVLLNTNGVPYTDADAGRFLQMIADGAYDAVAPTAKFTTTHGMQSGPQKSIEEVLKQKLELSTNIKKSYDEHKRANGTQDALFELGRFVAFKTGAGFVPGTLKGWDGVIRKTMDFDEGGYKGNYQKMKDEVRMTLVGENAGMYKDICLYMRMFCKPRNKMSFIKDSPRDPNVDPCGYSDTNMVVELPNKQPGEVQVNNRAVLYGKMGKESFCRDLGVRNDEYMMLGAKYGIEGGLGHAFYEIYGRVSKGRPNGDKAAALSKRYYGILRSYPVINVADRIKLVEEIKEFKKVPENILTFAH